MPNQRILHTAVIGAGQAGLAAGYYLRRRAVDFTVLDAHKRTGDTWRNRWQGLHLFSPNRYNTLPGRPPAGNPGHLPDRRELADYLEDYARHWRIPVRHGTTVTDCLPPDTDNAYWTILTDGEAVFAEHLIVATGAYRTPFIPQGVAASFPSSVAQRHAADVRDPAALVGADTDVVVLGAGASGQQLSRLFHAAGARVTLCGPQVGNLPRRLLGKDIYWWLYKLGTMTARTDGFAGKCLVGAGGSVTVGEPKLPDDDRFRRVKHRLEAWRNGRLVFAGKNPPAPVTWPAERHNGLVVWCTGYRNAYPFLPDAALGADGSPVHDNGKNPVFSGLFFLGLPNLTRPNSSLVGGVGRDAERIVGFLS